MTGGNSAHAKSHGAALRIPAGSEQPGRQHREPRLGAPQSRTVAHAAPIADDARWPSALRHRPGSPPATATQVPHQCHCCTAAKGTGEGQQLSQARGQGDERPPMAARLPMATEDRSCWCIFGVRRRHVRPRRVSQYFPRSSRSRAPRWHRFARNAAIADRPMLSSLTVISDLVSALGTQG